MRILRVAQKVYPEVKGGGPYHVHAMSRDQAANGHHVTVLTIRSDPNNPYIEEREGYTIIRFDPSINVVGNDISLGLAQYLRENSDNFDVIHSHSHLYFSTNLAAMKSRVSNIPLAITNHGLYSQTASRQLQRFYLRTAGRWTFNQADIVFCYTEEEKQRLRSHGVDADIDVISNGIDHTRFCPDGETSNLIHGDGPVVLDVARLVEGKRPKDAIRAADLLREKYPDIEMYLCGDGHMRSELEDLIADKDLMDNVLLLGNIDYDMMPRLYRSCDVVILPSEEEAGCPRVILESMATKKPFVIADKPQTSLRLKQLGKKMDVGDVEQLAANIDTILSTPDLQDEIGEEGRELVEQEFNWKQTVEETTTTLEQRLK